MNKYIVIFFVTVAYYSMIPFSISSAGSNDVKNFYFTVYELNMINDAILEYQELRKDHKPPRDLMQLLRNPSITSDDAIDNRDHNAILSKTIITDTDINSNKFLPFLFKDERAEIVKSNIFVDAWGKPLNYRVNADNTFILSATNDYFDDDLLEEKEITKDSILDKDNFQGKVLERMFMILLLIGALYFSLRVGFR